MITPPTAPAPGKPVSASFFGSLIRWVKSRLLIAGVGYRLRTTPNGTVLELDLPKVGGASAARIPGRFEVSFTPEEVGEGEEQTYTATFANPYYDIGGKTYELKGEQGTGNGEQGTGNGEEVKVSIVGVKSGEIITLKINAGPEQGARLATYRSIDELQEVQTDDTTNYTVPLYAIGEGGSVVCDFRTGPIAAMGEF